MSGIQCLRAFAEQLKAESQENLRAGAEKALSTWQDCRDRQGGQFSPDQRRRAACDVLVWWATQHKLDPLFHPELEPTVMRDAEMLVDLALQSFDMDSWFERLHEFLEFLPSDELDEEEEDEALAEASSYAHSLFAEVDASELTAWAAEKLGYGDKIVPFKWAVGDCLDALLDNLPTFSIIAPAILTEQLMVRPDLQQYDRALYETTRKQRALLVVVVRTLATTMAYDYDEEFRLQYSPVLAALILMGSQYERLEDLVGIERVRAWGLEELHYDQLVESEPQNVIRLPGPPSHANSAQLGIAGSSQGNRSRRKKRRKRRRKKRR